jgi:hypothetical protein
MSETAGNAHINHGPCNLDSAALAVPGSEWDGGHIKRLSGSSSRWARFVTIIPIRVSQVEISVGISLIPLLVYMDLASDFLKPTEDDLQEFGVERSQFQRNPFHQAFLRISEAMMTRAAHVLGLIARSKKWG